MSSAVFCGPQANLVVSLRRAMGGSLAEGASAYCFVLSWEQVLYLPGGDWLWMSWSARTAFVIRVH